MIRNIIRLALAISCVAITGAVAAQPTGFTYHSLTPCRVVDTRNVTAANGGPALGTTTRDFQVRGLCGVPTSAKAATMNVTVTAATTTSWLTIWPSGTTIPTVSTINFSQNDWALANGMIMGLSTNTLDLSVKNANGATHVIIDVTGYFE